MTTGFPTFEAFQAALQDNDAKKLQSRDDLGIEKSRKYVLTSSSLPLLAEASLFLVDSDELLHHAKFYGKSMLSVLPPQTNLGIEFSRPLDWISRFKKPRQERKQNTAVYAFWSHPFSSNSSTRVLDLIGEQGQWLNYFAWSGDTDTWEGPDFGKGQDAEQRQAHFKTWIRRLDAVLNMLSEQHYLKSLLQK